uniref:Uncharacterized protein n=1 Tax=Myoviridae sp. ctbWL16 TaxID=2826668 RepID=A0A8S5MT01_9CAUD|nr:MAG TPA: hypothetical protein [Myoviridae sp. ctbWL16]
MPLGPADCGRALYAECQKQPCMVGRPHLPFRPASLGLK